MKMRLLRSLVIWVVVFIAASTYFYWKKSTHLDRGVVTVSPDDAQQVTDIIKRPSRSKEYTPDENRNSDIIGGAFALVDHNARPVTDRDYADNYKLVFFGFTYCPAVCPTELQKVTMILNDLGDDSTAITPLFITVDPERDTPEQMKQYVAQFHPSIIGLTGTQEQIDEVKQGFRVYASKVENDMMEEYMMDHSAFLYLMDRDNRMMAIYPSTDTAEQIAADIRSRNLDFNLPEVTPASGHTP